jgi:hypothetical protein
MDDGNYKIVQKYKSTEEIPVEELHEFYEKHFFDTFDDKIMAHARHYLELNKKGMDREEVKARFDNFSMQLQVSFLKQFNKARWQIFKELT